MTIPAMICRAQKKARVTGFDFYTSKSSPVVVLSGVSGNCWSNICMSAASLFHFHVSGLSSLNSSSGGTMHVMVISATVVLVVMTTEWGILSHDDCDRIGWSDTRQRTKHTFTVSVCVSRCVCVCVCVCVCGGGVQVQVMFNQYDSGKRSDEKCECINLFVTQGTKIMSNYRYMKITMLQPSEIA